LDHTVEHGQNSHNISEEFLKVLLCTIALLLFCIIKLLPSIGEKTEAQFKNWGEIQAIFKDMGKNLRIFMIYATSFNNLFLLNGNVSLQVLD
jgi:hypothetical protein